MRLLADECVPMRVVLWLRAEGHDVVHLSEQGLSRLPDPDVFAKATAEDRVVLTFDLDFGEIAARSRGATSVLVFRLRDTRAAHLISRLAHVLPRAQEPLESGAIVVVEATRFRVRRLPIGG